MVLNIGQHNLSKTAPQCLSKIPVILSPGVPNHGFSGLKAFWFNNNAVYCILDSHPEPTHIHVFSLYWEHKVIQATSVQRPKSVFIEWILQWQLCKCKSCPLCATQYIRFQIYNLIEFWNPSFYKKRLGPHAGPHHFINARFLVNQFFRVFLERLMLQHVINEIPLGTSFYKHSTFSDHFINTFGL